MINSEKNLKQEKRVNLNNRNIMVRQRGKLLKFLLYGKSFLPLFLSHHPECKIFGKSHTINIGKFLNKNQTIFINIKEEDLGW